MANRIEILVTVDPTGQGSAGIRNINVSVNQLRQNTNSLGTTGSSSFGSYAAGAIGAIGAVAGLATVVYAFGKTAVDASNAGANSLRTLQSDAQSAGVSFAEAKEDAASFGKDLALGLTEAETSYSRFLRVVSAAGLTENVDVYRKQFSDLAAAYGLTSSEVETLTSQLLSGQDEALNRLGIADPSSLYRRYAESIGKTVEQLSEEEKVRARLLAVTEKGAGFEGAAAERLTSSVGQWAQLSANISNATRNLGDFLQTRTLVGAIPLILQNPFNVAEAQMQQEEQRVKAKGAIARAQAEKDMAARLEEMRVGHLQYDLAKDPSLKFTSFDYLSAAIGSKDAGKLKADFVAQFETLFKAKEVDAVTLGFAERQFQNIRGIFDPEKQRELQAGILKLWEGFAKPAFAYLKGVREASEGLFGNLTERYAGDRSNPFVKIFSEADTSARKLEKTFGVLGTRTVNELQRIEDGFTRQRVLGLQLDADLKAAGQRREADALANPRGLSGGQERQLGELDSRVAAAVNAPALLATAEAIRRGIVGSVRVSAEELFQRQYAANRGREFSNLTEEEKFFAIDGRKSEIEARDKDEIFFSDSGLNINQDKVNREVLDQLRALEGFGGAQGGQFQRRASDAVNGAIIDLFNSLSPEAQARIATGREGLATRGTFAEAFTGRAGELQNAIQDEIEKALVADRAIAAARADLEIINKAKRDGLEARDADARLLATTGALDPKELTGDLREARIDALRRDADRAANLQSEANVAVVRARESTDKLTASVDALALQMRDPNNRRLIVDINNKAKADVREELYGSLKE